MRIWLLICLVSLSGCGSVTYGPPSEPHWNQLVEDQTTLYEATPDNPVLWTIASVPGREPFDATVAEIRYVMDEVFGSASHSELIDAMPPLPALAQQGGWSFETIQEWTGRFAEGLGDSKVPFLIFMFVDGGYVTGNRSLAGIQIGPAAVVFKDQLTAWEGLNPGLLPEPGVPVAERAVAVHELGHALGLVNTGIEMLTARTDPDDSDPCLCHSNNPESVMHSGIGTLNAFIDGLYDTGYTPHKFDAHDWEDLRHARQEGLARVAA